MLKRQLQAVGIKLAEILLTHYEEQKEVSLQTFTETP